MPLRKLEPVDPVALATDTGAILARIRRPATTRGFQDALQRFGAYLNELPGNTRAPEDELKPEDRQMFECFLVHARKTYAHSTVLNAVLGPLNQFVSVVRCLRAARKMFFFFLFLLLLHLQQLSLGRPSLVKTTFPGIAAQLRKALLHEYGDQRPCWKDALLGVDIHYAVRRLDIHCPYDVTRRWGCGVGTGAGT
jgi:hypothetical protein